MIHRRLDAPAARAHMTHDIQRATPARCLKTIHRSLCRRIVSRSSAAEAIRALDAEFVRLARNKDAAALTRKQIRETVCRRNFGQDRRKWIHSLLPLASLTGAMPL